MYIKAILQLCTFRLTNSSGGSGSIEADIECGVEENQIEFDNIIHEAAAFHRQNHIVEQK